MPKKGGYRGNALAKRVKKLEQKQKADDKSQEQKVVYYHSSSFINANWTANFDMCPRTTQGTAGDGNLGEGYAVRIGNSINLRSLVMNGIVTLPTNTDGILQNGGSSGQNVNCRIIIADNLSDRSNLLHTDVLQDSSTTSKSLISSYQPSIKSGKKYRILADYKFHLSREKGTKRIKFVMPLPKTGRVVHYDGESTNPSDLNLTMLTFSDVAPLSANQPDFSYCYKARFEDA